MKKMQKIAWAVLAISAISVTTAQAEAPAAKPQHAEYKDWRVLGVSHRLDKKFVRSILGNDVAIAAARAGKTQPWPDGTIIAKLSWKEQPHPNWPQAIVPGEFAGAEAMVKDSKKFADTGGWGFGHWEGKTLVMNSAEKTATCFACHTPMKDHDYVYTAPVLQ
ncbi:MAG: cytochrome P460 family protein [Methylococcales bacterium]|nr:cytochrome P460 family protein [Methylococcales bacterium]